MRKIQKTFFLLFLLLSLLLIMGGCKTKNEDEGKVLITANSDKAKEEYLEGRSLSENLQGQESLQHYTNAIEADSNFALAYLNRSFNQPSAKGFFDDLNKAVSLVNKVSEGERLQILGFEAGVNANPTKQKEDYEKLVAMFPNDQRAHVLLGNFYYGQQDYQNALAQFNKAAEIDSNFSPSYNMLGYSNRQLMNYDAAEKAFKKYTELIPDDPNPYDSYAELLLKEGKYDQSIEYYQKALAHNPHFVSSILGVAANEMYKGNYDSARTQIQKLFDMARNDGERRTALFVTAVTYADEGNLAMSLDQLTKEHAIAEKNNDNAAMSADLLTMANILWEMGKNKEALKNYQKSVEMFDKSSSSQKLKDNVKLGELYNESTVALNQAILKLPLQKLMNL